MGDVVVLDEKEHLGLVYISGIRTAMDDSVCVVRKSEPDIVFIRFCFPLTSKGFSALASDLA